MKRYSLIGLLLILAAVAVSAGVIEVPEAPARMTMPFVGAGGGAAPAGLTCTTANDSEPITGYDYDDGTATGGIPYVEQYAGSKVVFSVATRVTEVKFRACSEDTSEGTITVNFYSDNSGCSPTGDAGSCPNTVISGTSGSVSASGLPACTTRGQLAIALSAPYEFAAGTYWVVFYSTVADVSFTYDTASGRRDCFGEDGSSWECYNDEIAPMVEINGCQ